MPIKKYLNRLERIDILIRRKSTGNAEQFADKMNMSRSTLLEEIKEMRELGAPILFDSNRNTYFYEFECYMNFKFKNWKSE